MNEAETLLKKSIAIKALSKYNLLNHAWINVGLVYENSILLRDVESILILGEHDIAVSTVL